MLLLAIGEIQNFLAYKSNTNLIQSTYKLHLKLIQALYPCTLACSHINTKWIESFSAYKTNTNLIQSAYKLHLKLIQAMQPCALAGNRRNTICRLFSQHINFFLNLTLSLYEVSMKYWPLYEFCIFGHVPACSMGIPSQKYKTHIKAKT